MGRFFRTSTPQNIDFMYKQPEDLMFRATQQASQDITQNQAAIYDLYGKLKVAAIDPDKERANALIKGYESKINDLTKVLQENPLAFRRKTGDILGLSRELAKDFSTGELASINNRYATVAEWRKRQLENKDIKDKQSITLAERKWINDYAESIKKTGGSGWNPTTESGMSVPLQELYNTEDIQKKYDDYAKDMFAKTTATATAYTDGMYIWENGETRVQKTAEEIMQDLNNRFQVDEDTQNYLKQRQEIGSKHGWYTEGGELIKTPGSQYYTMLASSAQSFKRDDITHKTASLKTDTYGTQEAAGIGGNKFGADSRTQVANFNPLPTNELNKTADISEIGKMNTKLMEENKILLPSVGNGLVAVIKNMSGINKTLVSEELDNAIKSGNVTALIKACEKYRVNTASVNGAIEAMKSNNQQIENNSAIAETYKDLAKNSLIAFKKQTNPGYVPTQEEIITEANSLMKKADSKQKIEIVTTNSHEFTGKDRTIAATSLGSVKKMFEANDLPPQVLVSRTDPNTKEVTTEVWSKEKVQSVWDEEQRKLKPASTNKFDIGDGSLTQTTPAKENFPFKASQVNKTLQSVSSDDGKTILDQPYEFKLGNNITIYADQKHYPSNDLQKVIENSNVIPKTSFNISLRKASILGSTVAKEAKDKKVNVNFNPIVLRDGVRYMLAPDGNEFLIVDLPNGTSDAGPITDQTLIDKALLPKEKRK